MYNVKLPNKDREKIRNNLAVFLIWFLTNIYFMFFFFW
jgi:hypothetical protein